MTIEKVLLQIVIWASIVWFVGECILGILDYLESVNEKKNNSEDV